MKNYLERYNIFFLTMIKLFHISENDRYGRTNIMDMVKKIDNRESIHVLDIAAGSGKDLMNVKRIFEGGGRKD